MGGSPGWTCRFLTPATAYRAQSSPAAGTRRPGVTRAAGAHSYVVKSRLASDLIPALQAALGGQSFISPFSAFAEVP